MDRRGADVRRPGARWKRLRSGVHGRPSRTQDDAGHILAIVRLWFNDLARLQAVLPSIATIPTLLVWGDRDRAVSAASGERLKQELRADLVIVPGGGHVVFEEMPEETNRVMLDWLRAGSATGGRGIERVTARGLTQTGPESTRGSQVA